MTPITTHSGPLGTKTTLHKDLLTKKRIAATADLHFDQDGKYLELAGAGLVADQGRAR